MSKQNNSKQIKEWCIQSKKDLTTTARYNFKERLKKILSIIKSQSHLSHFHISTDNAVAMWNDIKNAILTWKGVAIGSCKKQKKYYKQYQKSATNWFNRNKPKIFGNHFFYPIIFNHLLNFISNQLKKDMNNQSKMNLFINTLLVLSSEIINFKRSRSQPLIPYQILMQPNLFKSECIYFMKFYGIIWKSNYVPQKINRIYQKNGYRSKMIHDLFVKSLQSVQNKLLNINYDDCEYYKINSDISCSYSVHSLIQISSHNSDKDKDIDTESTRSSNTPPTVQVINTNANISNNNNNNSNLVNSLESLRMRMNVDNNCNNIQYTDYTHYMTHTNNHINGSSIFVPVYSDTNGMNSNPIFGYEVGFMLVDSIVVPIINECRL